MKVVIFAVGCMRRWRRRPVHPEFLPIPNTPPFSYNTSSVLRILYYYYIQSYTQVISTVAAKSVRDTQFSVICTGSLSSLAELRVEFLFCKPLVDSFNHFRAVDILNLFSALQDSVFVLLLLVFGHYHYILVAKVFGWIPSR